MEYLSYTVLSYPKAMQTTVVGGTEVFEVKSLQIARFILVYSDTAFRTLSPVLQCKHRAETGVAVSHTTVYLVATLFNFQN